MAITTKPEILQPRQSAANATPKGKNGAFSDEDLDTLSHLLDDFIRIPGTPIRFGLDGIVGFIPGIGDILGGLASTLIIVAAWSRGVPRVVLARMVANVAIETVVGSVPVLGNLFDIGWKANRRNYALLTGTLAQPQEQRSGRSQAGSWLYIAGICLVLGLLILAPVFLLGWLLAHIKLSMR